MFANAIKTVGKYTFPIKFIARYYNSTEIIPGAATLFFINEDGVALTCKHVAEEMLKCDALSNAYLKYKEEKDHIPEGTEKYSAIEKLDEKYGFKNGIAIQYKNQVQLPIQETKISIIRHEQYDLAIVAFQDCKPCANYAVLAKSVPCIQPGDFLCRYGYPFTEFSNYTYNSIEDDIVWTNTGKIATPPFPIEGMMTRQVCDSKGQIYGFEVSTPGLRGQSGGPAFLSNGVVVGMQSQTANLHLGFDQWRVKIRNGYKMSKVNDHPFLHVGRCISVEVIKDFLDKNHIKYYVGDSLSDVEVVNEKTTETDQKGIKAENGSPPSS